MEMRNYWEENVKNYLLWKRVLYPSFKPFYYFHLLADRTQCIHLHSNKELPCYLQSNDAPLILKLCETPDVDERFIIFYEFLLHCILGNSRIPSR
ncbi:hypothetical protein RclHR1_02610025 [Rhizophagus clarus]|uniref:Uncharacterized protein n=1 Tax=Rhizophagus clarus TaxID=94130 RepID=A0A2Z6RUX8_9GLOM|nr:hypothetical protein RclHR1_02610025 [Rhizophagus clarus]